MKHGAKPDVIDGVSLNNQRVHYTSMFTQIALYVKFVDGHNLERFYTDALNKNATPTCSYIL